MKPDETGRLVILSGPSCVGKSPLCKALGKFYPELHNQFQKLVLFNSRDPRPGELDALDYHFRTRAQVEALRADARYVCWKCAVTCRHWIFMNSNRCFDAEMSCLKGIHLWAGHCSPTLASLGLTG